MRLQSEDHIDGDLPPYAPELNPVNTFGRTGSSELPNVCPKDYWELDELIARKALRRMRRKPRLITAFWKQSSREQYIMRTQ